MKCPRCREEIPNDVTGCPYCMQAIDDADRPSPEEEARAKAEAERTPFDEIVLTYLARRDIWLLGSILLSPLAIGLGIAARWLIKDTEARDWSQRYLRLGAPVLGCLILFFCLKPLVGKLLERTSPVVVEVQGQYQEQVVLPGVPKPLEPRDGYEWVVVRATVRVKASENGKDDNRVVHKTALAQFHILTADEERLPPVTDTSRFGAEVFPGHAELRRGQSASGRMLFMVRQGVSSLKVVYEADPDPETREPRFVREFGIPRGAGAPAVAPSAPVSVPGGPENAPMPGDGYQEGGASKAEPMGPMPGSGFR